MNLMQVCCCKYFMDLSMIVLSAGPTWQKYHTKTTQNSVIFFFVKVYEVVDIQCINTDHKVQRHDNPKLISYSAK